MRLPRKETPRLDAAPAARVAEVFETRLTARPGGMRKRHLGVVSLLGAIGFTMCLLLAEVALPASGIMLPTLAVLGSSGVAALGAAGLMYRMDPFCAPAPKPGANETLLY